MKIKHTLLVVTAVALFALFASSLFGKDPANEKETPAPKQKVAAKTAGTAASVDAFTALAKVLRHPRCMNCHSKGDFPRQGDDGHQHIMNVRRGPKGMGVTAQKCGTCHQEQNVAGKNMPPGAPNWHLPPPDMPMIWQGLTDGQICAQLKDPKRNGKKTIAEIVHHMAEDKLVLWGWAPGEGRTPVPMPHAEFAKLAKQWADGGAACPK